VAIFGIFTKIIHRHVSVEFLLKNLQKPSKLVHIVHLCTTRLPLPLSD